MPLCYTQCPLPTIRGIRKYCTIVESLLYIVDFIGPQNNSFYLYSKVLHITIRVITPMFIYGPCIFNRRSPPDDDAISHRTSMTTSLAAGDDEISMGGGRVIDEDYRISSIQKTVEFENLVSLKKIIMKHRLSLYKGQPLYKGHYWCPLVYYSTSP